MSVTEERLIELLDTQRQQIVGSINTEITNLKTEITNLKTETNKTKDIATDAISLARENSNELEGIKQEIDELSKYLDEQVNRSMRKTLVIKGLSVGDKEKTWEDTENRLINLVINEANVDVNHAKKMFERAHRGKKNEKKSGPPSIYACLHDWKDAQYLIKTFKENNRNNRNLQIYIEQLYSPDVVKRRNQAMIVRKELLSKKEILAGYVEYPAILMVKKEVRGKYEKHSSY